MRNKKCMLLLIGLLWMVMVSSANAIKYVGPEPPVESYQQSHQETVVEQEVPDFPTQVIKSPEEKFAFEIVPAWISKKQPCQGTLYQQKKDGEQQQVWSVVMPNAISPSRVLVADNGQYVVAFDEVEKNTKNVNTVVIYGASGKIIKKIAANELLPASIRKQASKKSLNEWRKHALLDENKGVLWLQLADDTTLRIDLKTGEVLTNWAKVFKVTFFIMLAITVIGFGGYFLRNYLRANHLIAK